MEISNDMMLEVISGLIVIDKTGKVVYLNEACADYIKVNREKSIGKDINVVFPPSTMKKMLKGDKRFNIQYYFTEGRMSASSQVQIRKNGEVIGVLEYDMLEGVEQLDYFLERYSSALKEEIAYFREQTRKFAATKYSINSIIGSSSKIRDLKEQIEIAAASTSTVLIQGETGTGKELVAHAIHNLSARACHDFVKVNAVGMAENLIESELFGYVGGAFTGAKAKGKKGKFELADRGTLFLDEINQMPLSIQPKVLRALQEGEISPVGSEKDIQVNVRLITAANQDLEKLVAEKKFRADLFYRLNVFVITIPPLRERLEDIPELVEHRVRELNGEMGKNIVSIEPEVYEMLAGYDWPGNIRELYNRVESAMNYVQGDTLKKAHFNFRVDNSRLNMEALKKNDNPIEAIKREAERKLINETLSMFDNNKTQAAKYLKISRPLLYQKMKRLGIEE